MFEYLVISLKKTNCRTLITDFILVVISKYKPIQDSLKEVYQIVKISRTDH